MTTPRNRRLNLGADLPGAAGPAPELRTDDAFSASDPVSGLSSPAASSPAISSSVPRRRLRRSLWVALAAALAVGTGVGAWFALPVKTVTVSGNVRLSEARVQSLAGLDGNFGWLYYGHWRAQGLLDSPWVQSAVVTRTFPDRVAIAVTERAPRARWQRRSGEVVAVARDGAVLPGATGTESLPLISGWGPDRVPEALHLIETLSRHPVRAVTYTPLGVRVNFKTGSIWSGDPGTFVKYAGSIGMDPDREIYIYPWGVSVQE